MPQRFNVAIAGGGIAGLAAALAFRKAGFGATVVEQVGAFAPVGAGILLQANGLMVLDALGLGDQVRAHGVALPRFLLRDRRGRCLMATELQSYLPSPYWPVCIHRAHLHDILWQACLAAQVTVHFGCKVRAIDLRPLVPELVCETPDGVLRVAGNLIIGADGVKSAVRDAAGIPNHHWPLIEGGVQGVVPYAVPADLHGEYIKGSETCGMLPVGRDATFWFWGGSGTAPAATGEFARWKADIGERFPPLDVILSRYDSWTEVVRLQHRSVRCDAWSAGNVVLIGDAAHAMSPNLGQGANCALVDVLSLVGHVAARVPDSDLSNALTAFERDRRPLVDRLQQRGHDEGASPVGQWPGGEAIINLAIRLMQFVPSRRKRADILEMSGLEGDTFDLAAAGIRIPIPWLPASP